MNLNLNEIWHKLAILIFILKTARCQSENNATIPAAYHNGLSFYMCDQSPAGPDYCNLRCQL